MTSSWPPSQSSSNKRNNNNNNNPVVASTSTLLAQFAAKRSTPYGSIPPPSISSNHSDLNSNLGSKSNSSSTIKRSRNSHQHHHHHHHRHSNSTSAINTDPISDRGSHFGISDSPSNSLLSSSSSSSSSSSDRPLHQPLTSLKPQMPSSSVPNESNAPVPSLYNTSRGRTRNVSPSSKWERRCTSANVSSPAGSEDGNSTNPSSNNRGRQGTSEGERPISRKAKGKERQRDDDNDDDVNVANHYQSDDRRVISSSRERRKVENWMRRGDAGNQKIEKSSKRDGESSRSRGRRRRQDEDPNSSEKDSQDRRRQQQQLSTSINQPSNHIRGSSLLPPLSPPRSSENNTTFRGRSSTLVPISSSTSHPSSIPSHTINTPPKSETEENFELDRSFTPSLTRPHGALFSSDLDDEVLFSDSCSSDCSSEDLVAEGRRPTRRGRRDSHREERDPLGEEDDDEEDEEDEGEDYSISSTSASNSLVSNSRPSLSRSASTSPNASSEKRSSRSSHRNEGGGRMVGRRRIAVSEEGSSSQTSSLSPVKRGGGLLLAIKDNSSRSREKVEGKGSRRRKRRISSVERGRRRELRVLLAPPSPASNSNLNLNPNLNAQEDFDSPLVDDLSDASKGTRSLSRAQSRAGTAGEEESDREVLEFKSRNQRHKTKLGESTRASTPATAIVDDPIVAPAISMIRSKSEHAHQEDSTDSEVSTPKLTPSNINSSTLLNLGQLPGRKWLRNWSSSTSSSSSAPIGSESRSSSVPSLVLKSRFDPSDSSGFNRTFREKTSTVPTFVPADADPLGSNDLDENDSNDFKAEFAVDDLIQVESVVYEGEEDPKAETPIPTKKSWGKKFGSSLTKERTNSISSQGSDSNVAPFKLNPNFPTRSSTLLSTTSTLPPVILSAQTSQSQGLTTEEKLRRTSMNAANEQERRRGFAAAYAARLAHVGTNLWNWNRGGNSNNHSGQDPNYERARSESLASSNSFASTIDDAEVGLSNAANQIVDPSIAESGGHGNSGLLASGWRNLTKLPNLILMPAAVEKPTLQASTSRSEEMTGEAKEFDHPALTFLNPSNRDLSEKEKERKEEILKAQHEVALRMGPPSSPSPPASPSLNTHNMSSPSSLLSSLDMSSQNQSINSALTSSQILGGASKKLFEDRIESEKSPSNHQQSSLTSSDSNSSTATIQSDASVTTGRRLPLTNHSKGARGVLSAWEGDFDSGAYVSGLGQPIDPDTELSSVVHLQTFRSRSRDRRDRNEIITASSSPTTSPRSSPKSFSALEDDDAEDGGTETVLSDPSFRGKRSSFDISASNHLRGKSNRREQSRSDGSETMSANTLLFRYRSPSISDAIGSATTSTTRKPILAEAQRANRDEKKVEKLSSTTSNPTPTPTPAAIPSSSQLSQSSSPTANASGNRSLADDKSIKLTDPTDSKQDQVDPLDSNVKEGLVEEVKGLRRTSSLIDFSQQRRSAAREEERKKEMESNLSRRAGNEEQSAIPSNAIWNFRGRQTRPLMPKRSRSYRPAAESPVGEDFCAFPKSGSANGDAEASDSSSLSSSSSSSTSVSTLENEDEGGSPRGESRRNDRGRSGRRSRRDESPTSSSQRQCAVGLFSSGGNGNRRKSNAHPDRPYGPSGPRRDAKSSPNLPGLSRQVEKQQREIENSEEPPVAVERIGRRSRRGSKDEELFQSQSSSSSSGSPSQAEQSEERGSRGRNSRGRAGDVKVVSSSHGQTACQPYPLASISLGLSLTPSSSSFRSRSSRHSRSPGDDSRGRGGNRNSNHRTGRILPRPSSAPNLGKVLLQASRTPNLPLSSVSTSTEDANPVESSSPNGSLTASETVFDEPQSTSNGIHSNDTSASERQIRIPPARAPPANSQTAQNQGQYSNPPPRPTILSNGAHLLMLSLELEMIRKRKISAPLKPRWGKQRIRPGVSFTSPSTPMDETDNNGNPSPSSIAGSDGLNIRKGSGLRYEVFS